MSVGRIRRAPYGSRKARCLAFLCALTALLMAPSALASAPMCDEHAQTIEAPLPLFPSKGGEIKAAPACDSSVVELLRAAPAPDRQAPSMTADAVQRFFAFGGYFPQCPRGQKLAAPASASEPGKPGFTSSLFRPPRAR
jgi:hypothetical protein